MEPLPAVKKLSPLVTRILGLNPGKMTLQGTNTYLIGSGRERLLVDTSPSSKYPELLAKVLEDNGCTISQILVTHWHADHADGVGAVREITGAPPAAKLCIGSRRRTWEFDAISSGDVFAVDGATLKCVSSPGHTQDHAYFVLEEEGSVFCGDAVLGQGTTVFEDFADYMSSLHLLLSLAPCVLYPGHGPVVTDPTLKVTEYIEHRMERERQVVAALREVGGSKSATMEHLIQAVYADTIPADLHDAASMSLTHHLDKLVKDGAVRRTATGWTLA